MANISADMIQWSECFPHFLTSEWLAVFFLCFMFQRLLFMAWWVLLSFPVISDYWEISTSWRWAGAIWAFCLLLSRFLQLSPFPFPPCFQSLAFVAFFDCVPFTNPSRSFPYWIFFPVGYFAYVLYPPYTTRRFPAGPPPTSLASTAIMAWSVRNGKAWCNPFINFEPSGLWQPTKNTTKREERERGQNGWDNVGRLFEFFFIPYCPLCFFEWYPLDFVWHIISLFGWVVFWAFFLLLYFATAFPFQYSLISFLPIPSLLLRGYIPFLWGANGCVLLFNFALIAQFDWSVEGEK